MKHEGFLPKVQFFSEDAEYKTFEVKNSKTGMKTRGVVCYMPCYCDVPECGDFVSKGVSICSDKDEYDVNKGISIARTKAEMSARRMVVKELNRSIKQFKYTVDVLENMKKNLESYNVHDAEYISKF